MKRTTYLVITANCTVCAPYAICDTRAEAVASKREARQSGERDIKIVKVN